LFMIYRFVSINFKFILSQPFNPETVSSPMYIYPGIFWIFRSDSMTSTG